MSIPGNPISLSDLEHVWDGVTSIYTVRAQNQTISTVTFDFDGLYGDSTLTFEDANLRRWSPMTDCAILGIVVTFTANPGDTSSISITGPLPVMISQALTLGAGPGRVQVTVPPGRYAVQGGSTLDIRLGNTGISTPAKLLRVHIVTTTAWTKT